MDQILDSARDAINLRKHGLPPAFGEKIFGDSEHLTVSTVHKQDGEECYKVIGIAGEKLYTGAFAWRAGSPGFMSARRSNRNEEGTYRAHG